jgi:S1-C subfamily serine protease
MMQRLRFLLCLATPMAAALVSVASVRGEEPFTVVAEQVNRKVVKIYGSGGFRGLHAYSTGVVISPEGHILTVASHVLDTQDLRVHLHDGRRFQARVIVAEPELDAALLQLEKAEDLPCFDLAAAAKQPLAQPGDWVLAFTNQFNIATRDEPVSVQRGVIESYTKLHGRRGIFEAPYSGEVYVLDAVTNNPGAAGGALTTRRGELLGIVGKELRNTLTETYINYAVPVQSLAKFVEEARQGKYKPVPREKPPAGGPGGYHGVVLLPNVVERTPPYVEDVIPNSPAAKAGLRPDDLIVYVDGEQVTSVKSFQKLMTRYRPGAAVKLEVRRADKQTNTDRLVSFELKLEELPTAKKK